MSSIYVLEPPTHGRVVLHTTVGNIDVELWSKEAPKACRNFVQLCLDGYYDGTVFHRVVKNFIAQGGDPTGTGTGGESAQGAPFGLELHSRLRFNRRGLVAMACLQPGQNASQFFFTLGPTPELDRQNTIFGQVVGHSLFNMLRLGECETDQRERPLHPQRLLSSQVVANPFEDLVPREELLQLRRQAAEAEAAAGQQQQQRPRKSEAKATKNFALLSFGEEAEEEEQELLATASEQSKKKKAMSSHDLLDDPRLSAETAPILPLDRDPAILADSPSAAAATRADADGGDSTAEETRDDRLARLKREVAKVRRALHRAGPAPAVVEEEQMKQQKKLDDEEQKLQEEEAAAAAAVRKRRRRGEGAASEADEAKEAREAATLRMLAKFTAKMTAATSGDVADNAESGSGLFGHVFQSDEAPSGRRVIDASLAAASSAAEPERWELHDPRNPINKRRRKAAAAKMAGGGGGGGSARSWEDEDL